ncbi:ABC-type Fe3+ transport system permease subunit [Labrenzia sp. EL_208]|nr:ABC-type Fe3+ transport system permease subunit [Labrenzia sp. EL_132]MBG6233396.1 ABC-type Fe3+ transport system permease subunit [Labrenzia sp. EL_208]
MDDLAFWKILTAVLLGNLLTIGFLYCAYHINRAEKEGRPPTFILLLGFALPGLFVAIGAYTLANG